MLYHICKMTQTTIKLLLRNKGFLFFALALPILATIILNIQNVGAVITEETTITELSKPDAQIAYLSDYNRFPVKVYDSSDSAVTKRYLEHLASEGLFQIYRVDSSALTLEEVMDSASKSALKDKVGAIITIGTSFPQELLEGELEDGIALYDTSEDARYDLLRHAAEILAAKYSTVGTQASSLTEFDQLITVSEENAYLVERKEYMVAKAGSISSLDVDYERTSSLGYTMAILSLAFLLTGVMIVSDIRQERQNLVYTRILLTRAEIGSYMTSKFLVILLVSLLESLVTGAAYMLLVQGDLGLSLVQFLFLIFCTGLTFTTLSVCVGICINSVLSAIYLSFVIWVITALLGGLYFDITGASELMQRVAMLMPQRWALKGAVLFMDGNASACPMILSVTAAYLIVILVIGMLGLKLNRKE